MTKKALTYWAIILIIGGIIAFAHLLLFWLMLRREPVTIDESITFSSSKAGVAGTRTEVAPVIFEVTAYCPCSDCCQNFADGITASGRPAKGFFVAAPPEMPFGAMISIPGYAGGEFVPVLDRGGAIVGNRLDVFFSSHEDAIKFGRRYLEVRIK